MIKAIVTDIEGTTSSLSFVKETLFPYAYQHMAEFVRLNGHLPEVAKHLNEAKTLAGDAGMDDEALIQQLLNWIDEDKKITPLKALQGLIWEQGYDNKDFFGHIYDDAHQALSQWHDQGIRLYVYSSGSVYAQKLLYGHTEHGDLTPLFQGYFDTRIGAKGEAASYVAISEQLDLPSKEILFLSDIEAELDAAKEAGMLVCWLRRDGQYDEQSAYQQVVSFSQIEFPAITA